jgi:glyoxylase-like metal-dependent hydrolase (beta-lactamase superfamily II)
VLKGALAGAALGTAAFRSAEALAQSAADPPLALADDLYLLKVGHSNIVARMSEDGVVLIDSGPADRSASVLETVSSLGRGGGEVRTLFNTCWHPEQTGLNDRLGRAGATIIAHENTRLWLTQDITWPWNGQRFEPLPEVARPNKTFYKRESLAVGDKRVEFGHVRACPHTDGDCYVFFPEANVLAVGEAVSGEGWPSIDYWTGGWIGGVVGGLESLLVIANDETRIVPARGPVLRRSDLQAHYEMFSLIYERLATLLNQGRGPDEALAAHPTGEFDAKMGPPDEFVVRAFRSLWGYIAPDA